MKLTLRLIAVFLLVTLGAIPSATAAKKPLKVFILAGESKMQGHAKVSTFEHIGMDPATKPMLAEMLGTDGKPKVCERVWISSIGCAEAEQTGTLTAGFGVTTEKIGPEFTFGLYMQKFTDAPILLIKTSWGGKSLNTDFRPPSAGPYVFNETQLTGFQKQNKDVTAMRAEKEKATGVYYRLMIEHVKKVLADIKRVVPDYDAAQGYELAGFAWFQGWNDMVDADTYPQRDKPGGYDAGGLSMTVDFSTRYLGLTLKNPLVASACPLTGNLDSAAAAGGVWRGGRRSALAVRGADRTRGNGGPRAL